ncbi:alpha/beta hydrolase [Acetobacteraceae bacterium]|nr:alpha/beta hydrolase [Acetobacteraceae bacterium]
MAQKISFQNSNNPDISMSALLFLPPHFDKTAKYPAIVVTHPAGGVKEQTSGLYASKFAEEGFVTLAFDASYQGESSGTPRQLENPYIRTEDISAVIDYLLTLDYVNGDKIAAFGICAGGGYTVNAAINDPRIKVLGGASAADFGKVFREGWDGHSNMEASFPFLEVGANARTLKVQGKKADMIPLAPLKKEDAQNEDMAELWEYYHTERAQQPTSPSVMTARSLNQLVTYQAFGLAEIFLRQPVILSVGDRAGTAWMSKELVKKAKNSKEAKLILVENANHPDLYDRPAATAKVAKETIHFFKKHLEL